MNILIFVGGYRLRAITLIPLDCSIVDSTSISISDVFIALRLVFITCSSTSPAAWDLLGEPARLYEEPQSINIIRAFNKKSTRNKLNTSLARQVFQEKLLFFFFKIQHFNICARLIAKSLPALHF